MTLDREWLESARRDASDGKKFSADEALALLDHVEMQSRIVMRLLWCAVADEAACTCATELPPDPCVLCQAASILGLGNWTSAAEMAQRMIGRPYS